MVMVTNYIASLFIRYTLLLSLEHTHSANTIYTKHENEPAIPGHGRLVQEDCKFKANVDYIMSSRLS